MAQYLLSCDCGNSLKVGAGQAGGQIVCSCGRELEVPTLRKLRHLPPAAAEPAATGAGWNAGKGVAAVVLIVAGLLAVLTLANRLTEPVVPMFDASVQSQYAEGIERGLSGLTPVQAWEAWLFQYRPLGQSGFAVLESHNAAAIRDQIARRRFLQSVLLSVAGALAAVAIVIAVWSRR